MDRADALVFILLSEHDSLEAVFGRQGDTRLTVICVYKCTSVSKSLWLLAGVAWQIVLSVSHGCGRHGMQLKLSHSHGGRYFMSV